MNTKIFRSLSYGVYVIGTMDGERPTGCIANSAMQITSSPATIAISLNHDNYTNGCVKRSGKFTVSVLAEDSAPELIGGFGFRTGRTENKFEGVEMEYLGGMPVVKDSCGSIVCKVIDTMETATHTVFLGEAEEAEVFEKNRPMTYAYYHSVIKGKSPKNAPTYLPEEPEEKAEQAVTYVCQVCGYVYEGETLPEGFTCPVCKVGADKFKRSETTP